MWIVSSGSSVPNTLDILIVAFSFSLSDKKLSRFCPSVKEASRAGSLSSSGIETRQRVRSLASTPLNVSGFFVLMRSLSSPTVVADEVETGKRCP